MTNDPANTTPERTSANINPTDNEKAHYSELSVTDSATEPTAEPTAEIPATDATAEIPATGATAEIPTGDPTADPTAEIPTQDVTAEIPTAYSSFADPAATAVANDGADAGYPANRAAGYTAAYSATFATDSSGNTYAAASGGQHSAGAAAPAQSGYAVQYGEGVAYSADGTAYSSIDAAYAAHYAAQAAQAAQSARPPQEDQTAQEDRTDQTASTNLATQLQEDGTYVATTAAQYGEFSEDSSSSAYDGGASIAGEDGTATSGVAAHALAEGALAASADDRGTEQGKATDIPAATVTKTRGKKRFSTPAVAALLIAASLASSVVGGVTVNSLKSNGTSTTAANNSQALQALNQEPSATVNTQTDGSVEAVASKVLPSVVSIRVVAGQSGSTGSGSIISSDGTILTNNHVISMASDSQGATITVYLNDGTTYQADIVATDPETDLAVIKLRNASGLTPISLGDSSKLAVGQQVVAVGSPLGYDATVTSGIISAQNRPVQVSQESTNGQQSSSSSTTVFNAIQTDAAINPGNSGGALVDMDGNLIGIPSVIATTGSSSAYGTSSSGGSIGLGFAIPVNQARSIAEQLISNGKVQHPAIGVTVATSSSVQGALIMAVPSGGSAEAGGLKKGDVVTKVDDLTINSGVALIAAIRSHSVGDTVTLTVENQDGSNEHTVQIKLSAQESFSD